VLRVNNRQVRQKIAETKTQYNDAMDETDIERFFSQLEMFVLARRTPPYPDAATRKYVLKMNF
jgi:hypothetical protein